MSNMFQRWRWLWSGRCRKEKVKEMSYELREWYIERREWTPCWVLPRGRLVETGMWPLELDPWSPGWLGQKPVQQDGEDRSPFTMSSRDIWPRGRRGSGKVCYKVCQEKEEWKKRNVWYKDIQNIFWHLLEQERRICSRLLQQGREYNSRDKWEFRDNGKNEGSVHGKLLRGAIKVNIFLLKLT